MKKIVIALGGNALQAEGKPATAQAQLEVVEETAQYIADIIQQGYQVVVAHGNGPQVGRIVLQNEYAVPVTPAMPFDVCGAMSQGYIGYHIQQGLTKVLRARGSQKQVVTLVTQVLVDQNDPKFQNPSKPIGPFYKEEEAKVLAAERGYVMKEDAGRGWRRVVASPMPVAIEELDAVKCLVDNGFITVTVGGGGIPVIRNEKGELEGTAAVIDKDLASERLAEDLDADALVILTAVEKVSINFKKPDQKDLDVISPGGSQGIHGGRAFCAGVHAAQDGGGGKIRGEQAGADGHHHVPGQGGGSLSRPGGHHHPVICGGLPAPLQFAKAVAGGRQGGSLQRPCPLGLPHQGGASREGARRGQPGGRRRLAARAPKAPGPAKPKAGPGGQSPPARPSGRGAPCRRPPGWPRLPCRRGSQGRLAAVGPLLPLAGVSG